MIGSKMVTGLSNMAVIGALSVSCFGGVMDEEPGLELAEE